MIAIPEELLEQVERGNVLLFMGELLVRDADGQVTVDRLTHQLAARCGIPDREILSFPEVAQLYQDEKGRHALIQFLRNQLEAIGNEPQHVHSLVAGLCSFSVLISTSLSSHLEQAFEAANRSLDVIIGNVDVAFEDEQKARLYKLRGSLDRPESLILTEDDHEAFFRNRANLSVVLQGYLARKTILFVGYDLAEPLFKRLYYEVTLPLDNYTRRAYAFGETPSRVVARWCKRHGIDVIEADATAFLEALVEQLESRARPILPLSPGVLEGSDMPVPERPYKLLDYYEARDAGIFFGRTTETQKLTSLIHAHRLVLLYGASGTGKTSLLLAGALPRLEYADLPYETIYVRALEDPALAIRRAVQRKLPEADLPQEGDLVDFLDAATRALGCTLVVVLDQFEEFFIRLGFELRKTFVAELGELHDARDVPVKVVLSLREDWLAALNEIRARIPGVFYVDMRLLPLTREQAREAITAPVAKLGVSYEPALVEHLLDDLPGVGEVDVMPPQLQLVCSALYEGLEPDERLITLAAYERLGGARGVLQRYLDDEMARLGRDEGALARAALEELVTSQGTKGMKTGKDLALALAVDRSELTPVLEKLVRARLLRVLEREEGGTAYELVHEYLIHEIHLGAEARARKQAEELLRQEVENWKRLGTLLAADKLALVGEVRDVLRLDAEEQEFLLRSSLRTGQDVEYWPSRVSDPTWRLMILIESGRDAPDTPIAVRQRAAEVLGTQDCSEAADFLIELALRDSVSLVQQTARNSLPKLVDQHPYILERLQTEAERGDSATRRTVLQTLTMLPRNKLPFTLRLRVGVQSMLVRIRPDVAWLLGWVLASALGGAVGWIISKLVFGIIFSHSFQGVFGGIAGSEISNGILSGAIFGTLSGFLLGAAQTVALRQKISRSGRWVLASLCGLAVGGAVGGVIGWFLFKPLNWTAFQVGFWGLFGALNGCSVGFVQWLVLRTQARRANWWIPASAVGWAMSWIVVNRLHYPITEDFITLFVALAWGDDEVVRLVISDLVRWLVSGMIWGVVGGAITGVALLWLFKRPTCDRRTNHTGKA